MPTQKSLSYEFTAHTDSTYTPDTPRAWRVETVPSSLVRSEGESGKAVGERGAIARAESGLRRECVCVRVKGGRTL
jgi:hypothetical protein